MKRKPFRIRPHAPEGYMTVSQAADYLGVSQKSIRRYIKNYALPADKPAGMYLINRALLDQWVKNHE